MFLRRWWPQPLTFCRFYSRAPVFSSLSAKKIWTTLENDLHPNDLAFGLVYLAGKKPCPSSRDPRLEQLIVRMKSKCSEISNGSIPKLFLACSRIRVHDIQFWDFLAKRAEEVIDKFNIGQLVCILESLTTPGYQNKRFFQLVTTQVLKAAHLLTPSQIAALLDSLAFSRKPDSRLLILALCAQAVNIHNLFMPVDIAMSLNALRNLDIHDQFLLSKFSDVALEKAACFEAQEIVNTLSAFAHFDFFQPALVTRLIAVAMKITNQFEPLGIALLLGALEKFNVFDYELTRRLCEEALKQAHLFQAISGANTIYALAKFNFFQPTLFHRLFDRIPVAHLDAISLSKIVFALGKFRLYDHRTMFFILPEIQKKIHNFDASSLSLCIDGLATFGGVDESLLVLMCTQAKKRVSQFRPSETLCFLHGLFTLGHYDLELYNLLRPHLDALGELNKSERTHLFICSMCLAVEQPTWPNVPALGYVPASNFNPSFLRKDVAYWLRQMNVRTAKLPDSKFGGLYVDFVLPNAKCVIQLYGPSHFCFESRKPLGRTLLKQRLLEKFGWKVVCVTHFDWFGMPQANRRNYLKSLINT